jgi:hypothetical protein
VTTVVIVVGIVLCIALFVGVVWYLGYAIAEEKSWRARMRHRRWSTRRAAATGSRRGPKP